MHVPKKSKYLHLSTVAYKGRKLLPYYVRYFPDKSAPYLLLEIINTSAFSQDEINSFCAKCKEKGLKIIDIQNGLYRVCENSLYYSNIESFIDTLIKNWNYE